MAHDYTDFSRVMKLADISIDDPDFPVRTEDELKLDYILRQNNIKQIEQEVHCIPCDQILEYNPEILENHIKIKDHRKNLVSSLDDYFDLDQKEILSKKMVFLHRVFIIDEGTVACKMCDEILPITLASEHCNSNEHRLSLARHFEQMYDSNKLNFGSNGKIGWKHSFIETNGKTGDNVEYKLPELNAQFPDCDDFESEDDDEDDGAKDVDFFTRLSSSSHVTPGFLIRNRAAIDDFIFNYIPNDNTTE